MFKVVSNNLTGLAALLCVRDKGGGGGDDESSLNRAGGRVDRGAREAITDASFTDKSVLRVQGKLNWSGNAGAAMFKRSP